MRAVEQWIPRQLGAHPTPSGTRFRVFASEASQVAVQLYEAPGVPGKRRELAPTAEGAFERTWPGVGPGALYKFVLDGVERPDPYGRYFPCGVHGPAEVIDTDFSFEHPPPAAPPQRVIYELHIGTFTKEGTYEGAREHLRSLAELGITTLELMPVAAFPGRWGWGYDGVAGFAPFVSYGRPEDLQRFVDHAHGLGLEVILDVVYNHFGPDGNYLSAYSARYFDPNLKTPWGQAPRYSDAGMRSYAIDNAMYWLQEYRFDGLRFDACHSIIDASALHVLAEVGERARMNRSRYFFVAEDDRNDVRELERMGVDAVWADDFHHAVHALLTGERDGYYAGYAPTLEQIARTIARGFFYEGQDFPGRGPRGQPADRLELNAFIYCLQNHDQVGNRPAGTRLHHTIDLPAYRAASALLLFLPMTPLLFMGQEWAASTPFCYFTDHEPELGKAVTDGRRREFAHFSGFENHCKVPDPQEESTFRRSQLHWSERDRSPHREVLELYRRLLHLRQTDAVLAQPSSRAELLVEVDQDVLIVRRRAGEEERSLLFNWGEPRSVTDFTGADQLLLATSRIQNGELPSRSASIFAARSR